MKRPGLKRHGGVVVDAGQNQGRIWAEMALNSGP